MWSFLWSSIRVCALLVGICSFWELVYREWSWIYWTRIHIFYHSLAFSSFLYFLVLFRVNRCVFLLSDLLWVLLFFSYVVYPLCFFVMFSWLPYFIQKLFNFSCIRLLICFSVISPTCWLYFLSLFWNVLFCQYCFTLCQYLFNLPSFACTFRFISSSCIVIFSCIAFSFLSLYVPTLFFCFIVLTCFRRFFLSTFPVEFTIQVLIFSLCFLRGHRFLTN